MPPSLSQLFFGRRRLIGRDGKVVEMASLDTEMMKRECCVEGEGKGQVVVWLVKFAWIRACVKAGLPDHPKRFRMQAK